MIVKKIQLFILLFALSVTSVSIAQITVITHGFTATGFYPLDDWMQSMGDSISKHYGGEVFKYKTATETFEYHSGSGGHKILLYDWIAESNDPERGHSESAGDALFALLMKYHNTGMYNIHTSPIHFIGHSRGTVVNSECIERMIVNNISVSQQTSLDAHDWGLNLTHIDTDVNPNNSGIECWNGVIWGDSYYQESTFDLDGRAIDGTYQKHLGNIGHSAVHEWYLTTISDTSIHDGYYYSIHGAGINNRPAITGPKQVPFYLPIQDAFYNGDMTWGSEYSSAFPGWHHQGGGGDGNRINGELRIGTGAESKTHNRIYVPIGAKKLKFELTTLSLDNGANNDVDRFNFHINGVSKLPVIYMNTAQTNITYEIDISSYVGQIIYVTPFMTDQNGGTFWMNSTVDLDNFRFEGCDPVYTIVRDTICIGDQITVLGNVYDTTSFIEQIYTTAAGCDSVYRHYVYTKDCERPCEGLFFSEYIEGSGNNKAIEIYNTTPVNIDLSDYSVRIYSNGSSTPSKIINLIGVINPYTTFTIVNANADSTLYNLSNLNSTSLNFNGNDAVSLERSGHIIDLIGKIGENPGTSWNTGSLSTMDQTLIRGIAVSYGVINNPNTVSLLEWTSLALDDYSNIGTHLSTCSACPITTTDIVVEICNDDSIFFNNQWIKLPGTYTETIISSQGCDSIINMDLLMYTCTAPCSELFFSQYIEGTSNNKAVEIYNPTNQPIDLTDYQVKIYSNGSATPVSSITFNPNTIVPSYGTSVLCNSNADNVLLSLADLSFGLLNFNGNDAITIEKQNVVIDQIGKIGEDPGTAWNDNGVSSLNTSLQRKPSAQRGSTFTPISYDISLEWTATGLDNFSGLGSHSSSCENNCTTIHTNISSTLCFEDSIQFNQQWIKTSGTYLEVHELSNGCDSIITLQLTMENQLLTSLEDSICQGGSYTFFNQNITTAGTYTHSLTGSHGCDSIITLTLSLGSMVFQTQLKDTICSDDTYTFDNQQIATSGTYSTVLTSAGGCDSNVTLDLFVDPNCTRACNEIFISEYIEGNSNNKALEIYNPTSQIIDLTNYTLSIFSNGLSQSGTNISLIGQIQPNSTFIIVNSNSTSLLLSQSSQDENNLNFNGNDAVAIFKGSTMIDVIGKIGENPGLSWVDNTISTSNQTLVRNPLIDKGNANNPINFTISDQWKGYPNEDFSHLGSHYTICQGCTPSDTIIKKDLCNNDSTYFDSMWIKTPGAYADTISSLFGCDSVITLVVTTTDTLFTSITDSLCNGSSYTFGNASITTAGNYSDTLTASGGCDSIVQLTLHQKNCVGIIQNAIGNSVRIFPNPTKQTVNISIKNEAINIQSIYIVDIKGSMVYETHQNFNSKVSIDIHFLPPGSYFVKLIDPKFPPIISKIIKE